MSSYGSTHSAYLRPSQYQQQPPLQHQTPPYPTTPGPGPQSQPSTFYPPPPQQQYQQQPTYSTLPTTQFQQPIYSTSPASPFQQPIYSTSPSYPAPLTMPQPPPIQHRRTSSSASSHNPPFFAPQMGTAPILIPSQYPQSYQQPRHAEHSLPHSHHSAHAFGDQEQRNDSGVLDEDTLREYEKRYAKDRALEKRPTIGDSLISMVKTLGGKRE